MTNSSKKEIKLTIEAVGSTGEMYEITYNRNSKVEKLTCTCSAGEKFTLCKHRIAVFENSTKNINLHSSEEELFSIHEEIKGSTLYPEYKEWVNLDKELKALTVKTKSIKKALGKTVSFGIKIA